MNKDIVMRGVSNIYRDFFRTKDKKNDYLAYKTLIYQKIFESVTSANAKTPEMAFATMNILIGLKKGFDMIQEQYEMSKVEKII